MGKPDLIKDQFKDSDLFGLLEEYVQLMDALSSAVRIQIEEYGGTAKKTMCIDGGKEFGLVFYLDVWFDDEFEKELDMVKFSIFNYRLGIGERSRVEEYEKL